MIDEEIGSDRDKQAEKDVTVYKPVVTVEQRKQRLARHTPPILRHNAC